MYSITCTAGFLPKFSTSLQPTEAALFAPAKFIFTSVDCGTAGRLYKLRAIYYTEHAIQHGSTHSSCMDSNRDSIADRTVISHLVAFMVQLHTKSQTESLCCIELDNGLSYPYWFGITSTKLVPAKW